jgi:hypothetical protein
MTLSSRAAEIDDRENRHVWLVGILDGMAKWLDASTQLMVHGRVDHELAGLNQIGVRRYAPSLLGLDRRQGCLLGAKLKLVIRS